MPNPSALIAEDEPLLAHSLHQALQALWPELHIVDTAADGLGALQLALQRLPDVVFLDIRMPGMDGLDVARALVEDWPEARALPHIVFVTAYDQYALQAFDAQALDYLLKPVQQERLARTVERLKQAIVPVAHITTEDATRRAQDLHVSLDRIETALAVPGPHAAPPQRLQAIQASVGSTVHRVPLADVLFFAAADKYVRVVTAAREYLIRTPIKILLPQLDPAQFWQIHRSTVVQVSAIASVTRDTQGKMRLCLNAHPEALVVSRLHTDLFKAM